MNEDGAVSKTIPDELAEARDAIASLERRLLQSQRELELQRQREEEILNSTSWRITAPLRSLSVRLRNPARRAGHARGPARPPGASAGEDGDAAPGTPPDTAVARARSLLPQLPVNCISVAGGSTQDGNPTYRPLDLAPAMASVLDADAMRLLGGGEPGSEQAADHYVGRRADPPRVAFLGSGELLAELAFEARVTPIREQRWSGDLVPGRFAFALVETVWHVEGREWRYALTAEGAARPQAEAMLRHCRAIGLPVVAWFRLDAASYGQFAWLAAHADRSYAVDGDLVERLRRDHPQARVGLLPVAVQPAIHNPVRPMSLVPASNEARRLVLFDGWWDLVDGAAHDPLVAALAPLLRVAESEWDYGPARLDDCAAFKAQSLGCAGALDRAALGKLFGAEIVGGASSLLPPWRRQLMMLRSAAAGALVAQAGDGMAAFGPGLPHQGDAAGLAAFVRDALADPLQRARLAHAAFRQVMSGQCLVDRLQRIATDLGLAERFVPPPPRIACLLVTMRPQLLAQCLERFRRDAYPEKELIVVLHGGGDLEAARRLVRPDEPIRIFAMAGGYSLGACLNYAFAQTDAPFWTKMDDDDLYGVNYLSDLMLYQRTVDAPLMGKPIAFVYFQAEDRLHWVPSWAAQRSLRLSQPGHGLALLAGGSLVGRREVLEQVPFSERRRRGSDTDFLRRCHDHGYPVLATDCFNFALFRSDQPGFHTWGGGDAGVRQASGKAVGLADADTTVFI